MKRKKNGECLADNVERLNKEINQTKAKEKLDHVDIH